MSKLARVLTIGAMLAAMNLAGLTAIAQAQPPDAVEQFRRGEWASQEQTAADAALQRQLARERFSMPSGTPAQVPDPRRAGEPSGQSGLLVASLGVLAAALALSGGLAVLAAKRANRRVGAGHAA